MKNNPNVTKELADIARDYQNSQVRCNEIYNSIGKKFFELNRENPADEYSTMFAELEDIIKRQDGMEARRKFLNGIVVCTNCKADNGVNLSFCASCGTKLPHKIVTVDDGKIRCVNCSNILQPGQAFCGNCGAKAPEAKEATPQPVVEAPQPVAETQPIVEAPQQVDDEPKCYSEPVSEPVVEEAQPVNNNVTCNVCQTVITNPAAMFCPNCGNKVR